MKPPSATSQETFDPKDDRQMMNGTRKLRQRLAMIGLAVMTASTLAVMPTGNAAAIPPPNDADCKKLSHTADGLRGGSHHCWYAVTGTKDWRSWCDGRGGTWSLESDCSDVPGGRYKVDVWKTDPWVRQGSYYGYKIVS